jgi:hypothetical protein
MDRAEEEADERSLRAGLKEIMRPAPREDRISVPVKVSDLVRLPISHARTSEPRLRPEWIKAAKRDALVSPVPSASMDYSRSGQAGVIGELLRCGECCVHYRPHNTPWSLNPPS